MLMNMMATTVTPTRLHYLTSKSSKLCVFAILSEVTSESYAVKGPWMFLLQTGGLQTRTMSS